MDWLLQQAQTASPFIATFCVVVGGSAVWILWKQILFERSEHRAAEKEFTSAAVKTAKSIERLASAITRTRKRSA